MLAIDFDIGNVVLKNGGDVDLCRNSVRMGQRYQTRLLHTEACWHVVSMSWGRGRAVIANLWESALGEDARM